MIDRYLAEFDHWTAGRAPSERAELESHLRDAEQAGRLDDALERLGRPRDAARAFLADRRLRPSALPRRVVAACIDYGTAAAVVVAVPVVAAIQGVSVSFASQIDIASPDYRRAFAVVVAIAVIAFGPGLSLLEWRTGQTPGKALCRLRAVSVDGTALSLGQAMLRRLPLWISGPLQLLDWLFVLWSPRRQRSFEVIAGTIVVTEAGARRES